MKYKALKSGLWAIAPPNPGEYRIIENEIVEDIPERLIPLMLDSGCIETIKEDFIVDIPKQLNDIAAQAPNKLEAKNALEEWGIANLNYNIDKRKSIKNIIAELVSKHESKRKKMINAWNNK